MAFHLLRFYRISLLLLLACLWTQTPLAAQAEERQALLDSLAIKEEVRNEMRALVRSCNRDRDCLVEQADWLQSVGHTDRMAYFYLQAGEDARRGGVAELADDMFRTGLAVCAPTDNYGRAWLYNEISTLYWRYLGQLDSAAAYAYLSLENFGEEYLWEQNAPYMQLGQIHESLDQEDDALAFYLLAFQRASLRPNERFSYGFTLFYVLTSALKLQNSQVFDEHIGKYRDFMAGSKSVSRRHDAMLNLLTNNEAAISQLENLLDDPEFQIPARVMGRGDAGSVEFSHRILAAALAARGEFNRSEFHLRKSIALLEDRELNVFSMDAYAQLAELGGQSGNLAMQVEGLLAHDRLQDSLNRADYREQISQWEVRYETEKTEAELAQSRVEQLQTEKQRNLFILGAVLLALSALAIYLLARARLRLQEREAQHDRQLREQEIIRLQKENELTALRSMIDGQEAERGRIAKELHDGLGGLLTTVKAQLALAKADPKAEKMVDRAGTEVRRIAHNLMPKLLTEVGLSGALADLAGQLRTQGYAVEFEVDETADLHLDERQAHVLLRIAQELCQNSVKHAGPTSIWLQLLVYDERLMLTVEDDGLGFDVKNTAPGNGLGLRSIESRVAFLGGEYLLDSQVGRGTTTTISVPLVD